MNTLKSFGNINEIELCGKFATKPTLEERRDPDTGMKFSFVAVRLCVVEGQYIDGIWTEEAKNYFPLRFYQNTEDLLKAEIGDTMLLKGNMVTYTVKANEGGMFTSFYVKVRSHTPLVNEFSQNRKGNHSSDHTNGNVSPADKSDVITKNTVNESESLNKPQIIASEEVVTSVPTSDQNDGIDEFFENVASKKSTFFSRIGKNKQNAVSKPEAPVDGLAEGIEFDMTEMSEYVAERQGETV